MEKTREPENTKPTKLSEPTNDRIKLDKKGSIKAMVKATTNVMR